MPLGIGVGWMSDEFEIVGEDFHNRGKRTDEMIELMRKLWSEETIEHHGDYYDIPPIHFEPKPIRRADGIPIVVGGTSVGALRRAGRLGNGWIHHRDVRAEPATTEADGVAFQNEDYAQLEAHIAVINNHRADAGRGGADFEIVAGMGADYDNVRRSEQVGVTTCEVGPAPEGLRGTKDDFCDWIKQFADAVIGKVS